MTLLRQRMLEDLRIRNYAPSTVECYVRSVAEFAKHFNKPPDQLGPEEIRSWQLFLLNEKRVKLSTYIQAICGLRFFYPQHPEPQDRHRTDSVAPLREETPAHSQQRRGQGAADRTARTWHTGRCWPPCTAPASAYRK